MSFEAAALVLSWIAIAVLALGLGGLMRQVHLLRHVVYGEPIEGSKVPAPPLSGPERPDWNVNTVLLFADEQCASCRSVVPEFDVLAAEAGGLRFICAFGGKRIRLPHAHRSQALYLEDQLAAFRDFGVSATPFAVHVSASGLILRREPVGSVSGLREFVSSVKSTSGSEVVLHESG